MGTNVDPTSDQDVAAASNSHDSRTPNAPFPGYIPADPVDLIDPEAALRRELEGVRSINGTLDGLIRTLENARGDLATVLSTVKDATTLLNTWTRILSQTEHNQRLILTPDWHGSTQDLIALEADVAQRQLDNQRRAADEERRRYRRLEEVEDEQRRGLVTVSTHQRAGRPSSSTRGRTSSSSRGRAHRADAAISIPGRGLSRTTSVGRGHIPARGARSRRGATFNEGDGR